MFKIQDRIQCLRFVNESRTFKTNKRSETHNKITDFFITPSTHNTHGGKICIQQTTGFGLLAPRYRQVSHTGLGQSEGQDLVLLQCVLKIAMYFYSYKFYYTHSVGQSVSQLVHSL